MIDTVLKVKDYNQKLTVKQLAEALYEGTPHLMNLGEKLAKQHGEAKALAFFGMMGDDVQNFWMSIAQQLIDHSSKWEANKGSTCILAPDELIRLRKLPKHPEL